MTQKSSQRRRKFTPNGLVQPWDKSLFNYWRNAHLDIKLGWGPNGNQLNAFVPLKSRPNGRTKQVRAKLTNGERRNLRVTVFETGFDIG